MNWIAILAQTTTHVAQAGGATSQPGAGTVPPPEWLTWVPLIALAIIMYFFMFRTKKNEKSKRQDMLAKMKKGDEVQTIGGEYGRIVDLKDDRILLKVDETSNTKIWYGRNAIHRVVTDDDVKAGAK